MKRARYPADMLAKISLESGVKNGGHIHGRNIQHDVTNLLRQSVYSRLAGYEDVNDVQRLSVDPVMRAVTGKKKNAASANTVGRFETEILALKENLDGLSNQMAEVAISKEIFSEILFRVNRLRHCSL